MTDGEEEDKVDDDGHDDVPWMLSRVAWMWGA